MEDGERKNNTKQIRYKIRYNDRDKCSGAFQGADPAAGTSSVFFSFSLSHPYIKI